MTAVEIPLPRRHAYVDGSWVDADSGEWLELKYWAIGGLAGP